MDMIKQNKNLLLLLGVHPVFLSGVLVQSSKIMFFANNNNEITDTVVMLVKLIIIAYQAPTGQNK